MTDKTPSKESNTKMKVLIIGGPPPTMKLLHHIFESRPHYTKRVVDITKIN